MARASPLESRQPRARKYKRTSMASGAGAREKSNRTTTTATSNSCPRLRPRTHLSDFLAGRYILLQQRPRGGLEWIREEEESARALVVNEPDDIISVGRQRSSSSFISLAPGKSHTITTRIWPDTEFVEDLEVGASYSYQYIDNEIAWWDWGTKEVSESLTSHELPLSPAPNTFAFIHHN
ncbi:unnamed protein product [Periconia digitata]|uniref:Uncharacterized protein n=1 Tax=Periconia digitata TaxID=1303443 RepID=A0A9W4XK28_9PLEO|nr:unnamed protein product [Periconia digitata]